METSGLTEKYLSQTLEAHERQLEGIEGHLEQMHTQMTGAQEQQEYMVTAIAELKELLGLEEETETPDLKLVTDSEETEDVEAGL